LEIVSFLKEMVGVGASCTKQNEGFKFLLTASQNELPRKSSKVGGDPLERLLDGPPEGSNRENLNPRGEEPRQGALMGDEASIVGEGTAIKPCKRRANTSKEEHSGINPSR